MTLIALLFWIGLQSAPGDSGWPRRMPAEFFDLTYPAEALASGHTGVVIVRFSTDDTGRVSDVEPQTGFPTLQHAAVANLKMWRLSPRIRDGMMVYRFEIDDGACRDDSRSLFRLVRPNFAAVTACRAAGRPQGTWPPDRVLVFSKSAPTYPSIAQAARLTGVVVLELTFTAGSGSTRALTDLQFFTEAAVAHAREWDVDAPGDRALVVYEFALDNRDCKSEIATVFGQISPGYVRLSGCGISIRY